MSEILQEFPGIDKKTLILIATISIFYIISLCSNEGNQMYNSKFIRMNLLKFFNGEMAFLNKRK